MGEIYDIWALRGNLFSITLTGAHKVSVYKEFSYKIIDEKC